MLLKNITIILVSGLIVLSGFLVARASFTFQQSPIMAAGQQILFADSAAYIDWSNYTGNSVSADYATSAGSALTANLATSASTAGAWAANGANCSTGQFAIGVNASGAAESCFTPSFGTNADTVDYQHFNTTLQSGQPTYVWGLNSSGTAYPYSVSNLSVNYAATAYSSNYALSANYSNTMDQLASAPTGCASGQAATGVNASGTTEGCATLPSVSGTCNCGGLTGTYAILFDYGAQTTCNLTFTNGFLTSNGCPPDGVPQW